ncbi:hypothetical protein E2C01_062825 [Portunus trituberculatus]|uniref:Uncharacterized protein n=1 Tax=Portunus trituberculatus TaxID=210409 RepID=A0A5B7HC69_PORTR|nr:hypothetical protein [Portunus trituberculatus]
MRQVGAAVVGASGRAEQLPRPADIRLTGQDLRPCLASLAQFLIYTNNMKTPLNGTQCPASRRRQCLQYQQFIVTDLQRTFH